MKLFLVVLVVFAVAYGSNTPQTFNQDKNNDPYIEKLIVKVIESLKPKLAAGIPEINLPPLEPFRLNRYDFDAALVRLTLLVAKVTNIVISGLSDFKIKHFKFDLDNTYAVDLTIKLPKLEITAEYDIRGSKILFFPFKGQGILETCLSNFTLVASGVASPVKKGEKEYLQVGSLTTEVTVGSPHINIKPRWHDFFRKAAASLVKSNPDEVMEILKPIINEKTAIFIKGYLNDILTNVFTDSLTKT